MIAGSLEIQLLANMARLQQDMDAAKRSVGGAMADIERHVGAAKAALGGLAAGLLGGLSVAGLVNVAAKAIDAADAMNDLSQRVGISVKDLAKYELASKQSGTSMESLAKGIKGLAGNLMEHGDALRKAGIDAKTADGAMRQVAEVFARMPDGMEKTTLAVKLFGKSGMDLIPMLNLGAAGLDSAAEKSAKYAAAMAAMAPMADAYNDNMAELAMHNKVASMGMMNELLPALVAITGAMAEAAKQGGFWKGLMAGLNEFGNQAFDWSGNNARKGISTLTKDLADLQVQHDRITLDIFGAKGSIQTQIEEKTKALEAARKAYYGLTDGSAGGGRGNVNPANVKPATDMLGDYKALMAALDETKKKTGDANKEMDRQAKLLAELSGLSGSFAEDWARLNAVYAAGKLSTEQLTTAQAALLAKQPAMQAAAKAELELQKQHIKAMEDEFQAMKKLHLENESQISGARTMLDQLEYETRLLGMSTEQRALSNAERELERQGIVAGTEAYDTYIAKIRQAVVDKSALEQWQATWQSIDATAHDVFVNIFEGGQSAFKKLGNVLKSSLLDLLYQLTVRKWLINIGANMSGGGGGWTDMLAGATGNGTGASMIGGMLGNGGSMLGNLGNTVGGWFGAGGAMSAGTGMVASMGTGTALAATGSGLGLGAGAASTGYGFAASGGLGMTAGSAGASTIGAGLGTSAAAGGTGAATAAGGSSVLAAIPVWGWIALAAIAIASQAKGETRSGGQYAFDTKTGAASLLQGPSGGEIQGNLVKQSIAGTAGGINGLLKGMGSTAMLVGFQAGIESSDRGRGGVFAGGTLSTGATFGESGKGNNYEGTLYETTSSTSPDSKEAFTNFTTDMFQTTIQAVQAITDGPKVIAEMVKGIDAESLTGEQAQALVASIQSTINGVTALGSALDAMGLPALSFDAAAGLVAAAGGMDKLGASLGTYYDKFYTSEEKVATLAKATEAEFAKLGITMPAVNEGTRAWYRTEVERLMAMDQSVPANAKATAGILALAGSVDQLAPATNVAANSMMEFLDNVMKLVDGIHAAVTGSIFDMEYGMKDNPGKYGMLDVQAKDYDDAMRGATDIDKIADFAQKEINTINKAWALLDPTQQAATFDEFKTRLKKVDEFVTESGADAISRKKAETKEMSEAVAQAVEKALEKLSGKMTEAAIAQAAAGATIAAVIREPAVVNVAVTNATDKEVAIS